MASGEVYNLFLAELTLPSIQPRNRQRRIGGVSVSWSVFAASIDTDTPQISLPASVETQIETQNKPYKSTVFFHFKATGSLERRRAYHAAYEADAFTVNFKADYESGDLTITVERADES